MLISKRCRNLTPSATLEIAAKARKLRTEGIDIISLNAGEPDFDTPLHIKAAAMEAIQEGKTKYTAVGGTDQVKHAIVKKLEKENDLHYTTDEVMVSTGGKQVIFNALQALIEKGDEVIIISPYWTSYPEMIRLVEGEPVVIETKLEHHYKLNPKDLHDAISPYTKMIILNSPSNPAGVYYNEEELQVIANIIVEHPKIIVLSDDVYEKILFHETKFVNIVNVVPSLKDRTIIVNSLSKSYAMTGWRLGYAAGPALMIKEMSKIQSQSTSNPCSITQAAAVEALGKLSVEPVAEMLAKYTSRHAVVTARLSAVPGVKFTAPEGAFYMFPDVSELNEMLGFKDDFELTKFLLETANVSVIPGSVFGIPNHIRISFASNKSTINKAFDRIDNAISSLLDKLNENTDDL